MAYFFDVPPHDFPDRAHRQLLMHPQNLAELVGQAAPAIAPGLAFDRAQLQMRGLPLPDWRKRENDLFFEVPFKTPQPGGVNEVLIGLLLEHQTKPDPAMPLRTLVYATAWWDQQWLAWEKRKGDKPPLVLSPVLPIVFHAGEERWTTHRKLADLFEPPELFRPFVPAWQPVYWHLFEQPPEHLLQAAGPWLQTMALVRLEKADSDRYQQVCAEVVRRLELLAGQDKTRWHDLMCFLVGWEHYRRPKSEVATLDAITEASIMNVALREEVKTMSETAEQTWWEDACERARETVADQFLALGETRGKLAASRDYLRGFLERRFGALPSALLQRIQTCEDLPRLESSIYQVPQLNSPDELQL